MGYAPYYQAVPENSALLRSLSTDTQLTSLLGQLFTHGSRPLDLDEAGEDELNDTLDWLVDNSIAEDRAEADSILVRLRRVIADAERMSPGLVGRCCYVEKTQYEIEERLAVRLEKGNVANARELAATWILGGTVTGYTFRVVPSSIIASAAPLLREINPGELFAREREEYIQDDYCAWREMYLAAADRSEAILIY